METLTDLPLEPDERNRYPQLIANQTTNMRRLVEDFAHTGARLEKHLSCRRGHCKLTWRWSRATRWRTPGAISRRTHVRGNDAPHTCSAASAADSALGNLLSNAVR